MTSIKPFLMMLKALKALVIPKTLALRPTLTMGLVLASGAALAQAPDPVADGKRIYMSAGCHQCHGTVGQGGVGPRLVPKPFPLEALTAFVRNSSRSMPPYDPQVLSDDELKRIHTYLLSIAPSPPVEQIPQLR